MSKLTKALLLSLMIGVLGVAAGVLRHPGPGHRQSDHLSTHRLTRGDLTITISATGTVEPEEVVDVGAQVAGQILAFGEDLKGDTVDYGSVVGTGTVLARIDESLYAAEATKAEAAVRSAAANLARARADLQVIQARLRQAENDWQRARRLGPSEALAQADYDAYAADYEAAKANIAVARATIEQREADELSARAELTRAERNLGYCTIRSPVDGVVIDRRVNIGQTVVANLDAPSLFLLAKNLERLEVWVAVNEADVGKIRPGQRVTFTVDALPEEHFEGEVDKIRLNAEMTQNVVMYTVEVATDNSAGRLLPYLTATVRFELERRDQVLLVPNAALAWMPAAGSEDSAQKDGDVLWVRQGRDVRPLEVATGLTDGVMTEVRGQGLRPGMEIVTGTLSASPSREGADAKPGNPFLMKLPPGPGGRSGPGGPSGGPPGGAGR